MIKKGKKDAVQEYKLNGGKVSNVKKTNKKTSLNDIDIRRIEKDRVGLFFEHNMQLGPPYQILIDTNFINYSIQFKLDIFQSMLDCLLAKCIPIVSGFPILSLVGVIALSPTERNPSFRNHCRRRSLGNGQEGEAPLR